MSTIFWAPLFRWIIAEQGWHQAYLINAVLMAVLILPWTLFVIKRQPSDKGLQPYGYDPNEKDSGESSRPSA